MQTKNGARAVMSALGPDLRPVPATSTDQKPGWLYACEERVDICFATPQPLFRLSPDAAEFWNEVLGAAGASSLHVVRTDSLDAHVLSESSLLAFDDRAVLITCGATNLLRAVETMLTRLPIAVVTDFQYQLRGFHHHKNVSHEKVTKMLDGRTADRESVSFHSDETALAFALAHARSVEPRRMNLQILMQGLGHDARRAFLETSPVRRPELINQFVDVLNLGCGLSEFKIDDHHFDPVGYSLNAVRGGEYFTIHVSPQEAASFVSFEFDGEARPELAPIAHRLVRAFEPRRSQIEILHAGAACPIVIPGLATRPWLDGVRYLSRSQSVSGDAL